MDINPNDYAEPNWDGYGALPVAPETIEFAQALEALFSKPPEWAPAPDGTIGFEWVDMPNNRKVFIDIWPDRVTIYARVGERALSQQKSVA